MNKNLTELVFILDRSGSMGGLESDTVGGFNSMLDRQKKDDSAALVTTVLFDDQIETLHDRIPLAETPRITEKEYYVRGCTALLDAVGETVKKIENIHKYARPEDVPAHTLFVITTDGYENASRNYTAAEVKRLISKKREQGWEFLFMGANIDAVETAATIGISRERAVNYHADRKGTRKVYACVGESVHSICCDGAVPEGWSDEVDADYRSREKNK